MQKEKLAMEKEKNSNGESKIRNGRMNCQRKISILRKGKRK